MIMIRSAVLLLGIAIFACADEVDDVIEANNKFSPDLYKELYITNGPNYLVSTFSTFVGLATLLSGAKQETAYQIARALHLQIPLNYENGIKALLKSLHSDNYKLNFANGLFIDKDYTIKPEYINKVKDVYQAYVNNDYSFGGQPKVAAANINDWIKRQTNNSISSIIAPTELSDLTKLILLNALYLKADWDNQFNSGDTKLATFYINSGQQVKVDTMGKQLNCKFARNDDLDATFLELPFAGEDSSVVFALPNQNDGINTFEKEIHNVLKPQKFTQQNVQVYLPKFKIEQEIDFKDALAQLKVRHIFDLRQADLSGIVGQPGDIHLDRSRQRVSLSLSEGGVDAASAGTSIIDNLPPPGAANVDEVFKANHPFLYYIKIKGVIAFVGRVRNPLTE